MSNIAFSSATSALLETNSNAINQGNLNNAGKVYDASNENEEHFEERRVLPTFENATSHSAFVPSPSPAILDSVGVSHDLNPSLKPMCQMTKDLPC